tara:strand:- start:420 stop:590 length:171 start_codon:yes stop_codon:yes gene_type:complete
MFNKIIIINLHYLLIVKIDKNDFKDSFFTLEKNFAADSLELESIEEIGSWSESTFE